MSALFLVIPIALLVSAAAVYAFVWSVRGGQLDDLQTPALRILEDDQADRARLSGRPVGSAPGRQGE